MNVLYNFIYCIYSTRHLIDFLKFETDIDVSGIMNSVRNVQLFLSCWIPGNVPFWPLYIGVFQQDIDMKSYKKIAAHVANEAQKIVEAEKKEFDLTLFYVGVLGVLRGIRFDQSYHGFDPSWRENLMDCIGCKPRSILTRSCIKNLIRSEMVEEFSEDLNKTISILTDSKKTKEEVQAAIEKFGETPHVVISL